MFQRQPDNFRRVPNHSRGGFQLNQHRNLRENNRSVSQFNPNAREFIPNRSDGSSSYYLGENPQLTSLPLHQNQDFASGVNLHNPQQSDSGYQTSYQNTVNFNRMNTAIPRELQNVPNMASGQPMDYVPQQQQFPTPYGGFPFHPPVIQVMSAQEFLIQHRMLWDKYANALLELATLRGTGIGRPENSENIHPDISPPKNVLDSASQTDIVTHRPRKTQTDVTFESVGVQYEEISVGTEEECPTASTSEISLPSNSATETTTGDIDRPVGNERDSTPIEIEGIVSSALVGGQFKGASDSTKIQETKDVISDMTNVTTVNDTIDLTGNGKGQTAPVCSTSSEVQAIASSLFVSVQHKKMSDHSLEQEATLVSTTGGSLPKNSVVTTVTDTQSTSESRRAPSILIDFKSPKVLTCVSSQSMSDQCQNKCDSTDEKDKSVGVSRSKSYASVAAAVSGLVDNTKYPTTSKRDFADLSKNVKAGSNPDFVSPVNDVKNSAENTTVSSTSGTLQRSKVRKNVSADSSKNTSCPTKNRVQKKDKPVGRDAKMTSKAGPFLNYSSQLEAEPQTAVTSPDNQTQEDPLLKVNQENWIGEQGPPLDDVRISKILDTVTRPADTEALIISLNKSSPGEQKSQSEGSQMKNSENAAPIQSKQPTKSLKKSKTQKKRKGGKATRQQKKHPHAREMGSDDEEELNRAIENAKSETIVRNDFQTFMQTRVKRYYEAMDSTRYRYWAFMKERPKGHEFLEAIMEHWMENLSQLHNLDYHRSDKEIESLLNTRITKYSSSEEAEDWKLCLFFKLVYFMFKNPDTEVIVTQDLLYLFNEKKNDDMQRSFDFRYYQMMAELDSWQPAWLRVWRRGNPSLSAADLPPNSLDKKSIRALVKHINEQTKNRYLYNKDTQVTRGSAHVPSNAFLEAREEKLDWSPAKTKELFQERCEFWRKFENRNADQSKFILYYELLASITSSVIDFDAFRLSQCIQNVPKKNIEKIWFEEIKFMCTVFSFVASNDAISKS